MKSNRFLTIFSITLAVLIVAGCSASFPVKFTPAPLTEPKITAEPTIAPTATPAPDYQQLAKQAEQSFRDNFYIKLHSLPLLEENTGIGEYMAQADQYSRIDRLYRNAARNAYIAASKSIGFAVEGPGCYVNWVDWRLLFCLYRSYGEEDVQGVLQKGLQVTFTVSENGAFASLDLPPIYTILESSGPLDNRAFSAVLGYAYSLTVFGEDGMEYEYIPYMFPDGYLEQIVDPLPGKHIKDGWYKSRDGGKRYHTGTDIRADEGTPIRSCTDGVVQFNGTNEGAGNYIVILDPMGFAYHYYHMVQPTDFLKLGDTVHAGDVIGYVGNTGSSSANHLHLSVLSPEMLTINPYTMLKEVRRLQNE